MISHHLQLPPGPSFLIRQLFSAEVVGYVTSIGCIRVGGQLFDIDLPLWTIVSSSVAVLPAIIYAQSQFQHWRAKRKAESLGARLAPKVPSKWPAGIDLIAALIDTFKYGYPGDRLVDWLADGGQTIDFRTLWTSHIVTTQPHYIKMVLSTHFEEYEKGEELRAILQSLFGTGVFNSDGELWKFHRSMTRPFFSRERISDFELLDRHADMAIEKMKRRFKEGTAVDIQDLLSRFTMDTATEFLFGQDVKALSADLPYPSIYNKSTLRTHPSDQFATAFNRAQEYTLPRVVYGKLWPLIDFWEDVVQTNKNITWQFINPLIQTALEKKKAAKGVYEVNMEDGTLLDHLVQQTDDFDLIRDETFNILLAGRDTTAGLATFAITMLAENPDVFARIRSEVLKTLGKDGKVNPGNLREMKYLRAVLNETLRLYPSVPSNIRCSKQGALWPALDGGKPIYIPPNTQVQYSPWLMHRRTDLWGPTAQKFDPDRFLDDRVKEYLVANPFIFLPFNAGPRICLGQQFAYNEASTIVARIAQAFKSIALDMDSNPEAKPPAAWAMASGRKATEKVWVKSHVTLYAKGGVWVRMEEADAE